MKAVTATVRKAAVTRKQYRRRRIDPTTSEPDYSDPERQFMQAVDVYKRENRRPFPTLREVHQILIALGYRQVAPVRPLPGYAEIQATLGAQQG